MDNKLMTIIINLATNIPLDICQIVSDYYSLKEDCCCNYSKDFKLFIENKISDIERGRTCLNCFSNPYADCLEAYCYRCNEYAQYCDDRCQPECEQCDQLRCEKCLNKDNICTDCVLIKEHCLSVGILDINLIKQYGKRIFERLNTDDDIDSIEDAIERWPYKK
jgi:hypothetical protein